MTPADRKRTFSLAAKLATGDLTPDERAELANLTMRLLDSERDAREAIARGAARAP